MKHRAKGISWGVLLLDIYKNINTVSIWFISDCMLVSAASCLQITNDILQIKGFRTKDT